MEELGRWTDHWGWANSYAEQYRAQNGVSRKDAMKRAWAAYRAMNPFPGKARAKPVPRDSFVNRLDGTQLERRKEAQKIIRKYARKVKAKYAEDYGAFKPYRSKAGQTPEERRAYYQAHKDEIAESRAKSTAKREAELASGRRPPRSAAEIRAAQKNR